MPVSEFQRKVAAVALRAAAPYGFVLGGGSALILHGIVDRFTADVDLMTDQEGGVKAATGAVEQALGDAGLTVERTDSDSNLTDMFYDFSAGMIEWNITGPGNQQTVLQMAHFDRNHNPVHMDIVGPVLNPLDAIASKVRALVTRAEERDVIDVAAALKRHGIPELITLARQLEPDLTDEDFADAGRRLDRLPDRVFSRYGLAAAEVGELRELFTAWPRSARDVPRLLRSHHADRATRQQQRGR